jgi:hypothetical protein
VTEPVKNDPDLLNSGSGAGLMYFFDIMIKRNEVNKATGGALRTASRKYLELEDDPDSVDLRTIDRDGMSRRFVNKHRVELNEKSLETYNHRFRQAVDMYINFLDGNEWNTIKSRATSPKARSNGSAKSAAKAPTPPADIEPASGGAVAQPGMTTFPIPLRPGVVGKLILPDNLTQKEAKKVVAIVTALATEEHLAITAGSPQA